jgi:thiol-disulfide isomerase/thioredoxin
MRLLVLVLTLALHWTALQAKSAEPAVDFNITQLDGKVFKASAARGKYLIVNYWATWCRPCIKEIPELQSLLDTRSDVALIGLAYEDIDDKELQAFIDKLKVRYPIAKVDVYGEAPVGKQAPRGLPLTYVYGKQGELLKAFLGPVTAKDISALLTPAAAR